MEYRATNKETNQFFTVNFKPETDENTIKNYIQNIITKAKPNWNIDNVLIQKEEEAEKVVYVTFRGSSLYVYDGKQHVASSITHSRCRILSAPGIMAESVEAPDFTYLQLSRNPSYIISKYFPQYVGRLFVLADRNPVRIEKTDAPAKKESKKVNAEAVTKKFNVGDIVYTCWGYDQTNIDFYQIISRTARMCTVKQIACEEVDLENSGYGYGKVKPVKNSFLNDAPIRRCMIRVVNNEEVSICNVDGNHTGHLTSETAEHTFTSGH